MRKVEHQRLSFAAESRANLQFEPLRGHTRWAWSYESAMRTRSVSLSSARASDDATWSTSTVYDPEAAPPCPVQLALRAQRALHRICTVFDERLIAILDAPVTDTIAAGYAHKEQSLRDVFVRLDLSASRSMHARLSSPRSDDPLAERFARLTAERRARLLGFLADVRRRTAIAARGR
ncbi:MAG: hypothetical protein KF773_05985 [Deltaproteobacteria bacterium]|nr:hypothetical protein [Deltaproteobacteria bacterium]